MSDRDAYPSEMTNPFGPTDDELDGVFAGVAPADSLEEVSAFMLEVKTTCSDAPREEVATRHIAAMVEQSRETAGARPLIQEEAVVDRTRWRKAMDKMIATALKGAAGVLAASMSMMGLAYAGVDLPGEAAANAIEAVTGVELPNQGDEESADNSVAEDVKAVVEGSESEGCEFGQEVAAAASQNAEGDGPAEDACTEEDEDGEPQGSKATGDEKSAEGRAKATENSGGASDAGADNATTGTDRDDDGESNASTGKATAEEKSSGTGSDVEGDADGQGTASEQSGGASEGGAGNADNRP